MSQICQNAAGEEVSPHKLKEQTSQAADGDIYTPHTSTTEHLEATQPTDGEAKVGVQTAVIDESSAVTEKEVTPEPASTDSNEAYTTDVIEDHSNLEVDAHSQGNSEPDQDIPSSTQTQTHTDTATYTYIIVCPLCGARADVPGGDVRSLPIDTLIQASLGEATTPRRSSRSSSLEGGQSDGSNTPRQRALSDATANENQDTDIVLSMSKVQLSPPPTPHQKQLLCASHSKEKRDYCSTCAVMVCTTCVAELHSTGDHAVSAASAVDKMHRLALEKMIEVTTINATPSDDAMMGAQQIMVHVERSTEQLKRQADDIFDRLIVALRERKREFSDNLDLDRDGRLEILNAQYRTVSSLKSTVDSRLLMANQLLANPSAEIFMDGKAKIMRTLTETSTELGRQSIRPPDQGSVFLEFDTVGLAMSISRVGSITEHRGYTSIGRMLGEVGSFGSDVDDMRYPQGITFDCRGRLVICDRDNKCLKLLTLNDNIVVRAERLGHGRMKCPQAVHVDNKGTLYVSDSQLHVVQVYRGDMLVREIGGLGSETGQFNRPSGVCVHHDGRVFVADTINKRVQVFSGEGRYLYSITHENHRVSMFSQRLQGPKGLMIYENRLYVTDEPTRKVWVFRLDGEFMYSFGASGPEKELLNTPKGIALLSGNSVVAVVDSGRHRVALYSLRGTFLGTFGGRGTGDGEFTLPASICTDPYGMVWVSDTSNHRIQSF